MNDKILKNDLLLMKLYKQGLGFKCLNVFKNLYEEIFIKIRLSGRYSSEFIYKRRVRQE